VSFYRNKVALYSDKWPKHFFLSAEYFDEIKTPKILLFKNVLFSLSSFSFFYFNLLWKNHWRWLSEGILVGKGEEEPVDKGVDFFASAGRFVVVDVIEERGTAAEEFDAYDILKTPAVVLRQKGVGSVSDKAGFAKY
jgi:hypothetical protein